MNYLRVSVTSLCFLFFSIVFCQINEEEKNKYKEMTSHVFEDCEQAEKQAIHDVRVDSIKYFINDLPSSHNQEYVQNPDLYFKKKKQLDSLMLSRYDIKVVRRKYYGSSPDYTANCYDRAIINHMDTTYAKNFIIEAYNIVNQLNGQEPIDPTWQKEIKK